MPRGKVKNIMMENIEMKFDGKKLPSFFFNSISIICSVHTHTRVHTRTDTRTDRHTHAQIHSHIHTYFDN